VIEALNETLENAADLIEEENIESDAINLSIGHQESSVS